MQDVVRPNPPLGAILLSVLVAFAVGAAIYSWQVNAQLASDYSAVTRAYAVTNQLESLIGSITDGETGERGFLITGRDSYLEPYVAFTRTIDDDYATLVAFTAHDPDQSRQVASLRPLLQARRQELQSIIALRRESGLDVTRASASFDAGKKIHDQIRAVVKSLNDDEWRTINTRNADVSAARIKSHRGRDAVTLAVLLLGGGLLITVWKSRRRRIASRRTIQTAEAEQQRLQTELLRNYDLLDRVGLLAKIGGWEVDLATHALKWSSEVYKIHDMEPTENPSVERAFEFYDAADGARIQEAIESAGRTGGSWDFEVPFTTAKGRRLWVRTIGTAILRDGVAVKIQGAFQDVTERKQTETELKSSTRLLNSIIENIPCMVIVKRADNLRLETLNRAGESLLGYTRQEVIGRTAYDLFPKEEAFRVVADDRKLLEAGESSEIPEEAITRPNGEVRYAFTRKVVLRNELGQPEHLLTISLDVTKRRHGDDSMKLMNELLISARDRAESANQAKSQFLANMSHEIRTPMNAVLGMLQLLEQTELVRRQQDYVGKAHSAAKALLGILNDILDFSKIEAGKMSLDVHPFSLDESMRYLAVILSTSIGSKNIEALLDVDTHLPLEIQGDSLRLQQVLINLTSNAVKFTEHGEIAVSLKLARLTQDIVEIEFAVRDSGIGIAPQHLKTIFEGFSQEESSTARRFGGTGLGLAISKRLVELMGGALVVESDVGRGSRFSFSLSFARVATAGWLQSKYSATAISGVAPNQRLRVLVVDDNESARKIMYAMIEALGWQCVAVESGADALSILQRSTEHGHEYDVVFMDWRMPGMDGWETTKQIRGAAGTGSVPVIIMISAAGRETLVDRLRDEPDVLDGFLIKPITSSMLFDAVADAKAGGSSASGAGDGTVSRPPSARLAGLRLLVVEDNLMNQQVAYELLSNEGARVAVARNGRRGVEAALSAKPAYDAVLMDIQMPDIDGYTATGEIRRRESLGSMPIIAMTANAMAEDKAACLAAGMNDHIGKPIDLDILVATLLRHCRKQGVEWNPGSMADPVMAARSVDQWSATAVKEEFDKALRRVGGNRVLFLKMCEMFVSATGAMAADLRRALVSDDISGAKRLLHTLVGTAGTVGTKQLSNYATQMEQQLRFDGSVVALALAAEEFDALLQQSCDALTAYAQPLKPDAVAVTEGGPELDGLAVERLLDTLDSLMRDKNMRATHVFEELRAALGPALGDRLLDLERSMNELDFPMSLRQTQSLREALR
jgi:PAS domain S-box-containing protein